MDTELEFYHLLLPRRRFEIASGVRDCAEIFIVEAKHAGVVGYGSGTPALSVGDNPSVCQKALILAKEKAMSPDDYFESPQEETNIQQSPAAAAALDIAMHDLRAKMDGVSLARLLGGEPKPMDTDATIDLVVPDVAAVEAQRLAHLGFESLKIKVGRSVPDDLERVRVIRETVGNGMTLTADANGGYSKPQAEDFWMKAEQFDLEILEQPLPHDMLREMAELRDRSGVRICLDESVTNLQSLIRAIDMEAADAINLKLMKCGGLGVAIEMMNHAEDAGVGIMIGCMGDVGISIAAAAHFACSFEPAYIDLDSHLNIEPVCDGPAVRNGELILTDEPGLGVHMLEGWNRKVV